MDCNGSKETINSDQNNIIEKYIRRKIKKDLLKEKT